MLLFRLSGFIFKFFHMKKIFFIVFLAHSVLQAQNPSGAVPDSSAVFEKGIFMEITDLSFIKNNEYFNLIADGYTLFGNRINPEIVYRPHPKYAVSAGVMLLKYYGLDNFTSTVPYFGLEIKDGNHTYYFGKLQSDDFHHLSRQLYDRERLFDARSVENGMEHRYQSKYWQSDTWLEWEHFIQKNDDKRERLNFGHYSRYRYFHDKWQFALPFQLYLHHRGGQINRRNTASAGINNALVVANMAFGLSLQREIFKHHQAGVQFDAFFHFINSQHTEEFIFENGKAFQWRLFYTHSNFKVHVNYWQSHQFVSPKGDDMFQSVSRRVEKYVDSDGNVIPVFATHTESDRKLLYGGFIYQNEIFKNLFLNFTTDIFYQLNESKIVTTVYQGHVSRHVDYNMGLQLVFKLQHRLKSL